MQRRVVIAILCSTLVVVAFLVFWFVSANRGWGDFSVSGTTPKPTAPPVVATATISSGLERDQDSTTQLTAAQIQPLWDAVVQEAGVRWTPWVLVADAASGEVIFESGMNTPHTPASTMKLLTGFNALSLLDPFEVLETGVSQQGNQLYLWGEGDLTLTAGYGDPDAAYGHAGIANLADSVAANLQSVEGPVVLNYQSSLFNTATRSPAWVEQEVVDYAGDIAPFAIDTGRVSPGVWSFVPNSASATADALMQALKDRGIDVESATPGTAPEGSTTIATVQSAPLIDQIRYMLVTSDNTMAEQLCHLSDAAAGNASPDFNSSTQRVVTTLQNAGIDTTGVSAYDCSGLDSNSHIPPRVLVDVLQKSLQGQGPERALTRILPIAGVNGTLSDRLEADETYANLMAKTGSLGMAAVVAGAGTTASGSDIFVAIGSDDAVDDSAWFTRDAIDTFLTGLFSF